MEMVSKLLEKNSIDVNQDAKMQSMLQPTNPEKIEQAIDEQLKEGKQ